MVKQKVLLVLLGLLLVLVMVLGFVWIQIYDRRTNGLVTRVSLPWWGEIVIPGGFDHDLSTNQTSFDDAMRDDKRFAYPLTE